ncbi:MAG: hypothetical protein AB1750_16705 [Chloroflexota bacterium]
MNRKLLPLLLAALLASCGRSTPPASLTIDLETEFTLAPGQSASLAASSLTINLVGVSNDERCPSDIECAASGPVTLTISVQKEGGEPVEFTLQTFTGYDGRSPEGPFEGIQDRVEFEGYLIRVKGVLPYPVKAVNEIKDSEYRVTFLFTAK